MGLHQSNVHYSFKAANRVSVKGRVQVYDSSYRKLRKEIMDKNPLCAHCKAKGRIEPGVELDHIIPLRVNPNLKMDSNNLQVLCHLCHVKKGRQDIQRLKRRMNND